MTDLSKSITDPGLQANVRHAMAHTSGFRVELELPDSLRLKLEELDRVMALRAANVAK